MKLKHIGLFEGIGGFSLAACWAGWETVAWCEWNEFCQRVLKHHFPEAEGFGDITKTSFLKYANKIDILTGGFPCQPYSLAGKRLGKGDDRHLWPEMLRAIQEIQPTWVVGENVRGIVNWNGGLVFDEVQSDLEAEGYEVTPFLLPACSVDAPHKRDRVWFVAYSVSNGHELRRLRESGQKEGESESGRDQRERFWDDRLGNGEPGVTTHTNNKRQQKRNVTGIAAGSRQYYSLCDAIPGDWKNFPTQPPVCGGNDGLSDRLDGIAFSKWRNESIKAYGNAIVPQVAYQIFKAINQFNKKSFQNT